MDILLSVVLGELTTRSISFLMRKFSKQTAREVEDHLRRVLIQAQIIVDEAMGRHITNQAMLCQLNMLRDCMYRGYYILDTFRYHSLNEEATKKKVVSQTLSLSNVNFLEGLHSSNRNNEIFEEVQKVVGNLSSMINDAKEMVMFLMSYPRLYNQPYGMHLQLGNSMFGRQMETELVINFLLHTQPHGSRELEVLPIVGPARVGKSTLVTHVCKNEKVRDYFSKIIFLEGHDLIGNLKTLREGYLMEHQNCVPNLNKDGRLLVVLELVGDFNGDTWNKLYFTSKQCMTSSSKIIVTSRSEKIIKYGTTQALTLKILSHEMYWYFFKTLTFGSMDPNMHKNYLHVAMEIAKMTSGCYISTNIYAYLLRDNFDILFWCKVLAFLKRTKQKHESKFGIEHPFDIIRKNRLAHLGRMVAPSEDLVLYDQSQHSSQGEIPNVRIQDAMFGNTRPCGKSEVLAWMSPIPPYYSFVNTCEIRELKGRVAKRKR